MKDTADTKTPDMLGTPKRRGRPATGHALTPAQRQAKARQKRQAEKARAAAAYANHDPRLMLEDMREALQSPDPDDKKIAHRAWMAYGRMMGWM